MSTKPRKDTLRIAEEAAEWLDSLESASAETHSRFAKWLKASPRHLEEFLLQTASQQTLQDANLPRPIDLYEQAANLSANVVSLHQETGPIDGPHLTTQRASRVWHHRWKWAAVVGIVAIGLGFAVWRPVELFGGWHSFITQIGEQRTVELEDGSLVHLNARTTLAVRLSQDRRDLRLLAGEALFDVAHDPARPFRVDAGGTIIRAVGTRFNVDRHAADIRVAVIEGRVEITGAPAGMPTQLIAGEGANIVPAGRIVRTAVDSNEATAWRQRRLVFRDNSLTEIVSEFNRYNRTPQLVIEDPALGNLRYGGTFDADRPEALLRFLDGDAALQLESQGRKIVVKKAKIP